MKNWQMPNWVWQALLAVHFIALAWTLQASTWHFPDSGRYQQAAANLRDHKVLYARPLIGAKPSGKDVQEYSIRPPGYPLMLLVLKGHQVPIYTLIAQNVLSFIVLLCILGGWAAGSRISAKKWFGVLWLIVSFPGQFIYANALMSEVLMQFLLVATVGLALLYLATTYNRFFLGGCVVISIGLLVKPVLFPLGGIMAVIGAMLAWRNRQVVLLLMGIVPAATALSYMEWNRQRTGYFHFSSIAEINLLHYNAAGVVRQIKGPQAEESWVGGVLREANAEPTFAKRQKLIESKSVAMLAAHPVVYAVQHAAGMVTFFLDPGRFDISQFFQVATPGGGLLNQIRSGGIVQALRNLPIGMLGTLGGIAMANMVRLWLAVRGFRILGRGPATWRRGRWVVAGIIIYVALLTGPLGAARFMVPVWPLLLGLALVGVSPPAWLGLDSKVKAAAAAGENQG